MILHINKLFVENISEHYFNFFYLLLNQRTNKKVKQNCVNNSVAFTITVIY